MKCEYCGKEHDGSYGSGRFCCESCARKYSITFMPKTKIVKCQKCGKEFEAPLHSIIKVCNECKSKSKINIQKYIKKIEKSNLPLEIKEYYTNQYFNINNDKQEQLLKTIISKGYKICKIHKYNKIFIRFFSPETIKKFQYSGKKSAAIQSEKRRSKNEIEFCTLCENNFKNVLHNQPIFNGWDADIILEDYKIAILWNGAWHYKKITKKHSVKQVQNRDKIKIKEIINKGYKPYIIKDMGKYNKSFVENEFNKFRKFFNI